MKEKRVYCSGAPKNFVIKEPSASKLFNSNRKFQVLNVPLRAGKRKLLCACGAKLFIKKIGLTDFEIGCHFCGALQVSLLRRTENINTIELDDYCGGFRV
ncbi:hypothetical protein HZC07_01980 [Candidatus Micrarchaeota archaeon]|nr:hypothetical protein [Candidatus Micrarchaeota archaeon]